MSSLWLWVALGFYSLGLVHALLTVARRRQAWFRSALLAFGLGFIFHFVSLVEHGLARGRFPVTNIAEATSLFAFLITLGFLVVYWAYEMTSLSVFAFPIVFMMTLASALSQRPAMPVPPLLEANWVPVHVSFALVGYAALARACGGGLIAVAWDGVALGRRSSPLDYRLPPLD